AFTLPLADLRDQMTAAAAQDLPAYDLGDGETRLLAPIQGQEVWAAGVTYLRSREARVEEAAEKSVYERVYDAERPEIFMKGAARTGPSASGCASAAAARRSSAARRPPRR